jgi:molybdate transport system ATP-binding protein
MTLTANISARAGDFTLKAALSVEAGTVTGVLGPSGSGKTTLVHAIAGLIGDVEGHIALGARTLLDTGAPVRVPAHQRRIGLVFQDGRLFPHLDVRANLMFGAKRAPETAQSAATFDNVVRLFGIAPLLDRRPSTLSGGERQRVALGRAILSRPELLLLDEPLSALDPARRADLLPFLENLRQVTTAPIVYVSHAVEEIARLADRAVVIREGRIAADGPVSEVLGRAGLDDHAPVSVLTVKVVDAAATDGLIDLALGQTRLAAPAFPASVGDTVRLQISAKDVMLALTRPEGVSANNVLEGTVTGCDVTATAATVRLSCEGQTVIAAVTRRAFDRLALREGMTAYAVIKSVTIVH